MIKKITAALLIVLLMTATVNAGTLTADGGVNYHNGRKETYYNLCMEKVTENARKNGIRGKYWLREDGAKMWGHYVIIAAPLDVYPYGSIVKDTSMGDAIVLDTGGFAAENKNQIDIATGW